MARHKLYRWKVLLITEAGVGIFASDVWGADADDAIESARREHNADPVYAECVDQAWFSGETLSERVSV